MTLKGGRYVGRYVRRERITQNVSTVANKNTTGTDGKESKGYSLQVFFVKGPAADATDAPQP